MNTNDERTPTPHLLIEQTILLRLPQAGELASRGALSRCGVLPLLVVGFEGARRLVGGVVQGARALEGVLDEFGAGA
jgi:hypothetical protein